MKETTAISMSFFLFFIFPFVSYSLEAANQLDSKLLSLRPEPGVQNFWVDARKGSDEKGDGTEEFGHGNPCFGSQQCKVQGTM